MLSLLIATVLERNLTAYAAQPMSNRTEVIYGPPVPFRQLAHQNLSDLEDKLEKAREQGAKGYVINSAGGNDQMFGTAIIYK